MYKILMPIPSGSSATVAVILLSAVACGSSGGNGAENADAGPDGISPTGDGSPDSSAADVSSTDASGGDADASGADAPS
jgi:hypothetical protein